MWLRVTLALIAFRVAEPLREVRPFNLEPSMISNIHLLIPLTISDQQQPKLRISDSFEDSKEPGHHTDQDEAYSSIPGYAFTLDTDSILNDKDTLPKPKAQWHGHSLYLGHEWPHLMNDGHGRHRSDPQSDEQSDKEPEKPTDKLIQARLDGCRELGKQYSAEEREQFVQLCIELLELLVVRCKCCQDRDNNAALPWLSSLGNRRQSADINEYDEPVPRPRVRV